MSAFGDYAEWYDLFYTEKEYGAEAAYVDQTLREHGASGGTLLEVGCGTGAHAVELTSKGWQISGIDYSAGMLERARRRFAGAALNVELHQADARSFDLGRTFDAAVSLFHVMSYQAGPGALESALRAVRRHLQPGGLFLFDFWFGPAVMAERPESRVRTVGNERFKVTRKATPTLHEDSRTVDVRYHFEVLDANDRSRQEVDELHQLRYLFPEEMPALAENAGFELAALLEWMRKSAPSDNTWNACAVFRAMAD